VARSSYVQTEGIERGLAQNQRSPLCGNVSFCSCLTALNLAFHAMGARDLNDLSRISASHLLHQCLLLSARLFERGTLVGNLLSVLLA
jgi:hypothetical protein